MEAVEIRTAVDINRHVYQGNRNSGRHLNVLTSSVHSRRRNGAKNGQRFLQALSRGAKNGQRFLQALSGWIRVGNGGRSLPELL